MERRTSMGAGRKLAGSLQKGNALLSSSQVTTCIQPETSLSYVPQTMPRPTASGPSEILSFSLIFYKDDNESGEVGVTQAL